MAKANVIIQGKKTRAKISLSEDKEKAKIELLKLLKHPLQPLITCSLETYKHLCMFVYMYMLCVCLYVHTYLYISIYIYLYLSIYIYSCRHICICTHIRTHIYTYKQTRIGTANFCSFNFFLVLNLNLKQAKKIKGNLRQLLIYHSIKEDTRDCRLTIANTF